MGWWLVYFGYLLCGEWLLFVWFGVVCGGVAGFIVCVFWVGGLGIDGDLCALWFYVCSCFGLCYLLVFLCGWCVCLIVAVAGSIVNSVVIFRNTFYFECIVLFMFCSL